MKQNRVLAKEHEKGEFLYLIKEGNCTVKRMMRMKDRDVEAQKNMDLCIIGPESLIGDELGQKGQKYWYTVTTKSTRVVVYRARFNINFMEFEQYGLLYGLQKKFNEKQ